MSAARERTGAVAVRRRYRSELREQQADRTTRAVVEAAHELFVANGWSATGMREVAAAAGVALETVYSRFSSKLGLLRAVIDAAAVGDAAPERLARRPEFQAMGVGPRRARLRAAAQLLTRIQLRTAPIATLLRDGARADVAIGEILQATRERQRQDTAAAFELIVGRPPTPAERDGWWAIVSPEVYLLLVEGSGWTPDQYEAWIEATSERVLPRA
jgi:AcrR family transcriptional regulator